MLRAAIPGWGQSLPAGGRSWGQGLDFYPLDQLSSPRRQVGFLLKMRHFLGGICPLPFATSFLGVLDP